MLKSKKKALALAVLCAVSSMGFMSYASAEEPAEPDSTAQKEKVENNFTLNEMVVTATRTMKELKEVPSSVSVITAKEIEEKKCYFCSGSITAFTWCIYESGSARWFTIKRLFFI